MKLKKLINKSLIDEVSVAVGAASHLGAKGDDIDTQFAGGFNPKAGNIKKLLQKQVDDNDNKREFSDKITPLFDRDYIDLEWDYGYDEEEIYKIPTGFSNTSETEMQYVSGIKINYDNVISKSEENKKFINDTHNWKSIYDGKKY
jgi:hypothetical protein